MTTQRRNEIKSQLELGQTPQGFPVDLEELYQYILELEEKLEIYNDLDYRND